LDIAVRRGYEYLRELLKPVLQRDVPLEILRSIQKHFQAVIRERANQFVREHALRLPELEPLLEMAEPRLWFAVPQRVGVAWWKAQASGI